MLRPLRLAALLGVLVLGVAGLTAAVNSQPDHAMPSHVDGGR